MGRSRREDLLESAMETFRAVGFRAAGIERVLEEAGVSKMTLYNHFGSKDELIVAVLRRYDEDTRAALRRYVARGETGVDRLLRVVEFFASAVGDEAYRGCLFLSACAEFSDGGCAIRRAAAEHKRLLGDYVETLAAEAGVEDVPGVAGRLLVIVEGLLAGAQARCDGGDGSGGGDRFVACALALSRDVVSRAVVGV